MTQLSNKPCGLTRHSHRPCGIEQRSSQPCGITQRSNKPYGLTQRFHKPYGLPLLALCLALASAARARAELPSFLRRENSNVREGNEQLSQGDAKGALESYTRAARRLPDSPGVQLDRGLALMKQGELAKAREALLAATQPSAPADLRADAYRDLALAFYREADELAKQNKHAEAQKAFRESLDAAKRSLRLRPGDPSTAWNLELAARRVREEAEKQKQEEDKKKQEQEQKNQDQSDQSKDKSQDPNQDSNQDQQPSDGDKQQQPEPQSGDQKDKPNDQGQQQKPDQPPPKPEPQKDSEGQNKQPQTAPAEPNPPSQDQQQPDHALPPEAKQALDALEGGEENFERYRARQRAAQERRVPEKDW